MATYTHTPLTLAQLPTYIGSELKYIVESINQSSSSGPTEDPNPESRAIEVLSTPVVDKYVIILSVNDSTVEYIDIANQRYMSINLNEEGVNEADLTNSYFYTESSTVTVSPLKFSDLAQYFDGELVLYRDSYNLQGVLTQTQYDVKMMEYTLSRSTDVKQLVSRFVSILQTDSSNVQSSAGYNMSAEGLSTFIIANGMSIVYFKLRV